MFSHAIRSRIPCVITIYCYWQEFPIIFKFCNTFLVKNTKTNTGILWLWMTHWYADRGFPHVLLHFAPLSYHEIQEWHKIWEQHGKYLAVDVALITFGHTNHSRATSGMREQINEVQSGDAPTRGRQLFYWTLIRLISQWWPGTSTSRLNWIKWSEWSLIVSVISDYVALVIVHKLSDSRDHL